MPDKKTLKRARQDKKQGKAPSTQAGEFVREEIDHVREGKHGARSTKQAIAIGLSKARRAGVKLPPPKAGKTSKETRRKAQLDAKAGEKAPTRSSETRSRAAKNALKKEPRAAASSKALSKQAHSAARKRSASDRSAAARKAARTRAEHASH